MKNQMINANLTELYYWSYKFGASFKNILVLDL
jgi:hypothetical protein